MCTEQVVAAAKDKYGTPFVIDYLTKDTYTIILEQFKLEKGDLIVNLSVDVSSCDIIRWCQARDVLYIDTVQSSFLTLRHACSYPKFCFYFPRLLSLGLEYMTIPTSRSANAATMPSAKKVTRPIQLARIISDVD